MTDPVPDNLPALPTQYLVPFTGEVLNLNDAASVARMLYELRVLRAQLAEARKVIEDAMVMESQRAGTKTLRFGEYAAIVSGGTKIEWDVEELWKLRDAGLPEDRLTELVTTEVTYKVNHAVAKSIAAANPDYAAIIERARVVAPAPWRVSAKRERGGA